MAKVAFKPEQLQGIGLVAMIYNDAEQALHHVVGVCLTYDGPPREIISRINGTDGLLAIINATVKDWELNADLVKCVNTTLSGFGELKTLRDAVIHAHMHNAEFEIGLRPQRKGKIDEVLLSVKALDRLYQALDQMLDELELLLGVLWRERELRHGGRLARIKSGAEWRPATEIEKEQHRESIRTAMSQYRHRQHRRLSLPPFPEFPEVRPQ